MGDGESCMMYAYIHVCMMYVYIGATNFAIGIDLSTISSMHEVGSIIQQYEREMRRWEDDYSRG